MTTVHIVRINDSIEKQAFLSSGDAAEFVEQTLLPRLERQLRDSGRPDKFEPIGISVDRWSGGPYTIFLDTVEVQP